MSRKERPDPHRHFSRRCLRRCDANGERLYLTIEETAAYFQVCKSAVLEWSKLGVVPEYTLGGRIYFNREEVLAYWTLFRGQGQRRQTEASFH